MHVFIYQFIYLFFNILNSGGGEICILILKTIMRKKVRDVKHDETGRQISGHVKCTVCYDGCCSFSLKIYNLVMRLKLLKHLHTFTLN